MSMANIDTWNYAHLYIGRLWIKFGIIELILCIFAAVICILLDDGKTDLISLILIIIQCILLVATIIITERKLKMVFDENGNRR